MGLAAVPPPSDRSAPRTYEEIQCAIYNDRRADLQQRELLLAMAYAVYVAAQEDGVSPLAEARRILGHQMGIPRFSDLLRADLPRYESPREAGNWGPSNAPCCEAPRLRPYRPRPYKPRTQTVPPDVPVLKDEIIARRLPPPIVHVDPGYKPPRDWRTEDGVCGAASNHRVLEKDPRTGWVTAHWFCQRHKDHADRVAAQVREQNEHAPSPVPNRGGLLPCYFKADWEKVYRHYAPRWEPPKYGLCADDWPTPGESFAAHRRLRMVLSIDSEEA